MRLTATASPISVRRTRLAGVQAGEIAVEALPDGGKCMGFVGFLGADNAVGTHRRLPRGCRRLGHRTRRRARRRCRLRPGALRMSMTCWPPIRTSTCMVGFYSYNPPKIYEALQAAGKLGEITVIAFDEDPITLGAVREGSFAGTVVQDPYQWGYQGMHLMADFLEGDKSQHPGNGLIIVRRRSSMPGQCRCFRNGAESPHQAARQSTPNTLFRLHGLTSRYRAASRSHHSHPEPC
jgi:hypothetical protein